jgi:hypothetical protein
VHAQRFVGTHMVVLPAISIQPGLGFSRRAPHLQCPFQGAVKTFHLALRLGMAKAAPMQLDPLLHQPHVNRVAFVGDARTPPRNGVIHQHRLRHATAGKAVSSCSRTAFVPASRVSAPCPLGASEIIERAAAKFTSSLCNTLPIDNGGKSGQYSPASWGVASVSSQFNFR